MVGMIEKIMGSVRETDYQSKSMKMTLPVFNIVGSIVSAFVHFCISSNACNWLTMLF